MSEKVVGYSLIAFGLLAILLPALSVILVFTGNSEPVRVFSFEGIGINANDLVGGQLPTNQQIELISPNILNDTSNLIAHLFLMGFISTIGFRIATLGTMLVRPIVVKLKEASSEREAKKV